MLMLPFWIVLCLNQAMQSFDKTSADGCIVTAIKLLDGQLVKVRLEDEFGQYIDVEGRLNAGAMKVTSPGDVDYEFSKYAILRFF